MATSTRPFSRKRIPFCRTGRRPTPRSHWHMGLGQRPWGSWRLPWRPRMSAVPRRLTRPHLRRGGASSRTVSRCASCPTSSSCSPSTIAPGRSSSLAWRGWRAALPNWASARVMAPAAWAALLSRPCFGWPPASAWLEASATPSASSCMPPPWAARRWRSTAAASHGAVSTGGRRAICSDGSISAASGSWASMATAEAAAIWPAAGASTRPCRALCGPALGSVWLSRCPSA
mmetsp:Transcript_100676/g.323245  ORF Transcript_100676/g.323245 Transcript_100676/m.323245 type:complete len:231 (+) Transcript_100676:1334-2026(+)